MNEYKLKRLNELLEKKSKGWTLTNKDKKELKHLTELQKK